MGRARRVRGNARQVHPHHQVGSKAQQAHRRAGNDQKARPQVDNDPPVQRRVGSKAEEASQG